MAVLDISVGHSAIDAIHEELATQADILGNAPDADFHTLYDSLIEHTESHFAHEEVLMCDSGFVHIAEHIGEHRQMLGEMRKFAKSRLPIARAYVRQRLPERFALHITRMDSLLAAFLRSL